MSSDYVNASIKDIRPELLMSILSPSIFGKCATLHFVFNAIKHTIVCGPLMECNVTSVDLLMCQSQPSFLSLDYSLICRVQAFPHVMAWELARNKEEILKHKPQQQQTQILAIQVLCTGQSASLSTEGLRSMKRHVGQLQRSIKAKDYLCSLERALYKAS